MLLLLFGIAATAQDVCPDSLRAAEGSYELIPQSKVIEVFTVDVLCEIEARRLETEYVNWRVSELTVIRIHPRKGVDHLIKTEE